MNVRRNSLKAWLLAARPKTLSGAAVPVMIGLTLATDDIGVSRINLLPALLCVLFAFVMQIDANFVNDYFDFKKGNDDETRLGPDRACSKGWITPKAMKMALVITTLVACLVGLPLIMYGGWMMVVVGLACVLFCFLYTTSLSYHGMGDALVLLFFGIVPVCCTYYIQTHELTLQVVAASIACGVVIDTLLVVNNFRDIENDMNAGKKTLAVRLGHHRSQKLYFYLGYVACAIGIVYYLNGNHVAFELPIIYIILHHNAYREMVRIGKGRGLNKVLGMTARNILVYGLLVCVGIIMAQ